MNYASLFLEMLDDSDLCLSSRPQYCSNLDICGNAWRLLERATYLAGFDLVFGFAFFVEVAAVDVVYDRHGEVFDLHIL